MSKNWGLWHRITNRHLVILLDDLGEMRWCVRRIPGLGAYDGITYKAHGTKHWRMLDNEEVEEILRAQNPYETNLALIGTPVHDEPIEDLP